MTTTIGSPNPLSAKCPECGICVLVLSHRGKDGQAYYRCPDLRQESYRLHNGGGQGQVALKPTATHRYIWSYDQADLEALAEGRECSWHRHWRLLAALDEGDLAKCKELREVEETASAKEAKVTSAKGAKA